VRSSPIHRGWSLLGSGALAVLFLCFGLMITLDSVRLALDGRVTTAEVVAVRYGTKADYVRVLLPEPVDEEVELTAWSGKPKVGDRLSVRYVPSRPDVAVETGVGAPWWKLGVTWTGGVVSMVWFLFAVANHRSTRRANRASGSNGVVN
jgi:hypothetical protein